MRSGKGKRYAGQLYGVPRVHGRRKLSWGPLREQEEFPSSEGDGALSVL